MREIYKRLAVLAMCLLTTVAIMAQTTGYAITTNVNSKECNIFSFDVSDPSTVSVVWTDTVAGEGAVLATLAKDVYYAYMVADGASSYDFCSSNMTTGTKLVLNRRVSAGSDENWMDSAHHTP